MNTLWQSDTTIVDRVRICPPAGCPLPERRNVEHLLRNASLRPSHLPASAILFLRKLHDPLPTARWNYERVHPPREWEESATRELDRMAALAVRPALSPVPPSAEAVLFLDRGELLACLAADWLQGTLRANWWWFTLLKRGDVDPAIFREWNDAVEFVPVALEHLISYARATEFIHRLPDSVVTQLLEKTIQVFGIPPARPIVRSQYLSKQAAQALTVASDFNSNHGDLDFSVPMQSSSPGELPVSDPPRQRQKLISNLPDVTRFPSEPWLPFVPEASIPGLTLRKKVLLAQALMLRRAPAKVRTTAFQQELAQWQLWVETRKEFTAETDNVAGIQTKEQILQPDVAEKIGSIEPPQANIQNPQRAVADEPAHSSSKSQEDYRQAPPTSFKPEAVDCPPNVGTSFAGLFFLLNIALHLKLYADFTSPRETGLELDLWDFICLLGLELIGEEVKQDPIFQVLALLAGRSQVEPPGAYFDPPVWNVPESWLTPFPEIFQQIEALCDGWLQIIHPAGFVLADKHRVDGGQTKKSLVHWVRCMCGYIRARLIRATGREDAVDLLCRIPGRIVCTPTRVDIFYSLESYPIEIRLAGLDRDLGWIPAAGHYVAYHFQ